MLSPTHNRSQDRSDNFFLKWTDHHETFFSAADRLRKDQSLTDVTLFCGDGDDGDVRPFHAHKLVLVACSAYFARLFAGRQQQRQPKPAEMAVAFAQSEVFMSGVPAGHMARLLDYMYTGEVDVPEAELVGLLDTARSLEMKGLAGEKQRGKMKGRKKRLPVRGIEDEAVKHVEALKVADEEGISAVDDKSQV